MARALAPIDAELEQLRAHRDTLRAERRRLERDSELYNADIRQIEVRDTKRCTCRLGDWSSDAFWWLSPAAVSALFS